MIAPLLAAAGQIGAAAVGGPPPSGDAMGGNTSTPNTVTYNKGPDWALVGGALLVVGLVWLWKRKK